MIRKSLSVDVIKNFEAKAKTIGVSERILIENASSNLCAAVDVLNLGKKVLVVAGRGNNGADVLACARKLAVRGYRVQIAILKEKELGPETAVQKDILEKTNIALFWIEPGQTAALKGLLKDSEFIVEGILGTGVRGQISPFLDEIIALINASGKQIVSCDIPSGLHPDTGTPLGAAVKADYTVTFMAAKPGFFLNQGPDVCGKIITVDIGISPSVLKETGRD